MNLQQWAFLIVPNTAIIGMVAYVAIGLWINHRDSRETERQRERDFEQHRRML